MSNTILTTTTNCMHLNTAALERHEAVMEGEEEVVIGATGQWAVVVGEVIVGTGVIEEDQVLQGDQGIGMGEEETVGEMVVEEEGVEEGMVEAVEEEEDDIEVVVRKSIDS
jgi:hypothetical protein